MKRIVQILKGESLHGAERHVFDLSGKLSKSGLKVEVINVLDKSKKSPKYKYKKSIESIKKLGVKFHFVKAKNKFDIRPVKRIRDIINKIDPDIVHTHMPYADMFGGMAAKLTGQAPVVSTRHHDYLTSWTDWLRFVSYYAVAGIFLDALIAVSEHVASQAKSYEGWTESDVHVVHHGCRDQRIPRDTSRQEVCSTHNIPESCAIILSVGRLLKWKGHEYAVRALRHLSDANREIHWLIAGDGPQRDPLYSLASELGVSDSLHLLGYRDDVPRLMSAADVFVHPSTTEAFGIVLVEAMMQGTPIVGSRAGAVPEIVVNEDTGYLVEPADSKAISDAVYRLLEDPEEREEMGMAARKVYMRNYTLEKMTLKIKKIYRNLEV